MSPVCSKCGRMQPSAEISRGKCKDKARCATPVPVKAAK